MTTTYYRDTFHDGTVIRWHSSRLVPPASILRAMFKAGEISKVTYAESVKECRRQVIPAPVPFAS